VGSLGANKVCEQRVEGKRGMEGEGGAEWVLRGEGTERGEGGEGRERVRRWRAGARAGRRDLINEAKEAVHAPALALLHASR
jgi:hypothetical protein